ncbi:hypothetical protein [Nocardiopsis listeri]|uniref:hypothetical protein n=1 Tax=Nocardiopsis listeri TaxID=53440 RepID=UPI00083734FA|nr:hypothetical protein [Nocardiopsis listeri]
MAEYRFECGEHGGIDIEAAMGTAPSTLPCPTCHRPARRVFGAPMLNRSRGAVRSTYERAERSADAPDVVRSPPPRAGRPGARFTNDPAHRRLPKP